MNKVVKNYYHVTPTENVNSILENGILPSYRNGLMGNRDGLTYLTNSPKYMKIMAEDIGGWVDYTIFKVEANTDDLTPIWWKGKGFKEWTTVNPISSDNLRIIKMVNLKGGNNNERSKIAVQ